METPADKVDIGKVLEAVGVNKIVTVDPLDHKAAVEAVRECAGIRGVKAVIFRSPCAARVRSDKRMRINEKCIGCRRCINELGCPALSFSEGKVRIDRDLCTGCGLCSFICPAGAIEEDAV